MKYFPLALGILLCGIVFGYWYHSEQMKKLPTRESIHWFTRYVTLPSTDITKPAIPLPHTPSEEQKIDTMLLYLTVDSLKNLSKNLLQSLTQSFDDSLSAEDSLGMFKAKVHTTVTVTTSLDSLLQRVVRKQTSYSEALFKLSQKTIETFVPVINWLWVGAGFLLGVVLSLL